jgi:NAD(P)-dependent dehydrogenase (short-subunit alcohol dehydrogenase family)
MPDSTTPHRGHVLITGASTGIGRATALYLASLGFRVFAGVRRDVDGTSIEQEASTSAARGGRVTSIRLDVTNESSIAAATKTVRSDVGDDGLLGLVNNAGIGVVGPIEFLALAEWRRQFDVNLLGPIAVTQSALPLLRAHVERHGRGCARIVNMSSIAGKISQPILAPYASSKFALEALSDALRLELRPQGIQVCLVNPGAIDTPIWKKGSDAEEAIAPDHPSRQLYGAMIDNVATRARDTGRTAASPLLVARAVAACLTRRRPKVRTFVGADAKTGAISKAILPTRFMDRMLANYFRIPRNAGNDHAG